MSAVVQVTMVLCGLVSAASAATVEGIATVDGRPAESAVVYLQSMEPTSRFVPPGRAIMDQKNLTFVPSVLPVTRGTVVEFTNSDDVQHNVFSPSDVGGKFNLGTYGRGEVRSVTLNETGEVRVLCNVHMEMQAHILVLEEPYFATVAADGRYRIADVPPGRYAVRLWRERWTPFARTVEVPRKGTLTLDIGVAP